MIETRPEVLGHLAIITDDHTWRLDQARFDGVIESKIAHNPFEQSLFRALLPRRRKRCCREIEAGKNPARLVDAIKTTNPFGGFLNIFFSYTAHFGFSRYTPSVMRFIVNYHNVMSGGDLPQDLTGIGFIA